VLLSAVEAARNKHNLRLESPCDRHHNTPERRQILRVAHGRAQVPIERNVNIPAQACLAAALVHGASAREEVAVVVSMHRDVQDIRVVVGHLLGAIAVVHVPVHNQNPLQQQVLLQHLRHNRHSVEVAETERLVELSV